VRVAAAEALGQLGDPQAVEPLESVRKDSDDRVRRAAMNALRRLEESHPEQ
jgi:HEAT repeat protein